MEIVSGYGRVNWTKMEAQMEDAFAWYHFDTNRIIDLPHQTELEYEWRGTEVVSWGIRVFPAVQIPTIEDGMTYEALLVENSIIYADNI